MWNWLIGSYAAVVLALLCCAGLVAVWVPDAQQRADAYRVLKLVVGAVTGTGGVVALVLQLHEVGLL
jgi:hypothetical protein